MSLLDEVLEAHGGVERWTATRRLAARVRTGGLLPRTRMPGNRFEDVRGTAEAHEARIRIEPFPGDEGAGVFDRGEVRIETASGEVVDSRADPRTRFSGASGLRRNVRWDVLDSVYFAGYAIWNYVTTPFLLLRDGVEVREGERWDGDGERWHRLEATFPADLHTHSREQTFYFDRLRLLRRHDYTAEVIGGWARAANYCFEHIDVGGLVFPTRRRVYPRGPRGRSLGFPTLVSLDFSEIEVE